VTVAVVIIGCWQLFSDSVSWRLSVNDAFCRSHVDSL